MKIIEGDFIVLVSMHWQQHFSYYIYVENYCDFKFTTISEFLWSLSSFMLQFSDRQLQISHRVDTGAQNLNFASKFPQNGGFTAHIFFYFWKKLFPQENFPADKN